MMDENWDWIQWPEILPMNGSAGVGVERPLVAVVGRAIACGFNSRHGRQRCEHCFCMLHVYGRPELGRWCCCCGAYRGPRPEPR